MDLEEVKKIEELKERYVDLKNGIKDYEKIHFYFITHHSTKLEGQSLSLQQTYSLLSTNTCSAGTSFEDNAMVLDHLNALKRVTELAENKTPLSIALLQEISALLMHRTGTEVTGMGATYYINRGDLRTDGRRWQTRIFPRPQKIIPSLQKIFEYTNRHIKEVTSFFDIHRLAFNLHYDVLNVHPFGDGNSRISRLMQNYVQFYHEQPITPVLASHRTDLLTTLNKSHFEKNKRYFQNFMFQSLKEFYTLELDRIEGKNVDDGL